ncbi:MAG: hypothetical protein NTY30_03090 [Candidatus Berkelbacteria bacterium]|nr:hypothetical protein [Candidatus Berkelbacteria bacterium]
MPLSILNGFVKENFYEFQSAMIDFFVVLCYVASRNAWLAFEKEKRRKQTVGTNLELVSRKPNAVDLIRDEIEQAKEKIHNIQESCEHDFCPQAQLRLKETGTPGVFWSPVPSWGFSLKCRICGLEKGTKDGVKSLSCCPKCAAANIRIVAERPLGDYMPRPRNNWNVPEFLCLDCGFRYVQR